MLSWGLLKRFLNNVQASPLQRALICATAALVFGLSVFSASPALHAWLHSRDANSVAAYVGGDQIPSAAHHDSNGLPADDACAVVMFAQGVLSVVAPVLLTVLAWRVVAFVRRWESELNVSTPRYWLPPLCGPPAS